MPSSAGLGRSPSARRCRARICRAHLQGGTIMALSFDTLRERLRKQIATTVMDLRGAGEQFERAMARMQGSVDTAYDEGLEDAARIAEGIDSADGVRIAGVIRSHKRKHPSNG